MTQLITGRFITLHTYLLKLSSVDKHRKLAARGLLLSDTFIKHCGIQSAWENTWSLFFMPQHFLELCSTGGRALTERNLKDYIWM